MINKFLRKSWFPLVLRIIGLIFFVISIFILFYGSIKIANYNFSSKLVMFVVWTLWWPFLYITLFFIARLWCGFLCPLSLANELGNKIRNGKNVNILKWTFLSYIIFFFIVFLEQVSGLFLSIEITLIFFGAFLLGAFIIGMLFLRFSFCRLFCPIGTLLSVFSRLSMIGVRTNKKICSTCKTKECLIGGKTSPCPMFNNVPNLGSNKNCLICTNCIKNCPYDSAKLKFVKPGDELVKKAEFGTSESFFIISILGLGALSTANGINLLRFLFNWTGVDGWLVRLFDFIGGIGIFLLFYFLVVFISSKISGSNLKDSLKSGGYVYLPLAFCIMFFTITFGFLGPWLKFNELFVLFVKYGFILIGFIWGAYLIYKIVYNEKRKFLGTIPHFIFLLLICLIWLLFLIQAPNSSVQEDNIYLVESGEKISMNAFSMGFEPNIIKAKQGDIINLEIYNKDVMHAFDIDEFNIHPVLYGGETINLSFEATSVGEFEFYCGVPGHREAGMEGVLIVE